MSLLQATSPEDSLPRNSAFNLARLWLLKVKVELLSCVRLFATPWTVARQARLSMGFSRQEYWSGLPFPSPGDLSDSEIEPVSPALADGFFTIELPGKL